MHTPQDYPELSHEQGIAAIQTARRAQPAWAALPLKARRQRVRQLVSALVEQADELSQLIATCVGKTRVEALSTEVLPATMAAAYYNRTAWRRLRPHLMGDGPLLFLNKLSVLHRRPFGVVGIIAPWNYPLAIPMHEIIPALLCGNAVIFKTARETLPVGAAIERLMHECGVPPEVFHHVNLPGATTEAVLLDDIHHVDKLFFTGSVPVGKQLMARAARTLTPVSLELGGNDAMLVCPNANLERAVNGAIWAGLQNSGQSCGGVERIYVHRHVADDFLARLTQQVRQLRQGADVDHGVDVGALCTQRQYQTVQSQLDDAITQGATVVAQSPQVAHHREGRFFPATVLTNVTASMAVMREETFGPILAVVPVDTMDEAVDLANNSHLGLTASIWGGSPRQTARMARRLQVGVVTTHDHLMTHGMPNTPWGGMKESGIGRCHGRWAFEEMTEPQAVIYELLPFSRRNVFWQPYSTAVYAGMKDALIALYARPFSRRLAHVQGLARFFWRMFSRSG